MRENEKVRPLIDTLPPSSRIVRIYIIWSGSALTIAMLTSLVVWWWVKGR